MKFNWEITGLEAHPQTKVVKAAHWRVTATEGKHSATYNGSIAFAAPKSDQHIVPYDELTEATLIEWVHGSMSPEARHDIENDLKGQIEAKVHPVVVPTELPWAKEADEKKPKPDKPENANG